MFINKGSYFIVEEFEKLGIGAIYTADAEEYRYTDLEHIKEKFELLDYKLVHGHQTHSKNIIPIRSGQEGYFQDCDGFVTDSREALIYTKYADCLPVYFYDPVKEVIALSHSGWKGTFQRIVLETLRVMEQEFGSRPEDVIAALGIGICSEHYEVSEEFYLSFQESFSEELLEGVFFQKDGKHYFDNSLLNRNLLLEAGVKAENITVASQCTWEEKRLHSYRRDREASGRNGAFIYFKR